MATETKPCPQQQQQQLVVEHEEDLLEIHSQAATSLLSPNIWVHRPAAGQIKSAEALLATPRPPALNQNALFGGAQPSSTKRKPRSRRKRPASAVTPSAPGGDVEGIAEHSMSEEGDVTTIKDLEEEIGRSYACNNGLRQQLQKAHMQLCALTTENEHIKNLFVALGVHRDDLNVKDMEDKQKRRKIMLEIGQKFVTNLPGPPLERKLSALQRKKESGSNNDDFHYYNDDDDDDEYHIPKDNSDLDALQQNKGAEINHENTQIGKTDDPASITDFPERAHIAAAALQHSRGNPALALWHLIDMTIKKRNSKAVSLAPAVDENAS